MTAKKTPQESAQSLDQVPTLRAVTKEQALALRELHEGGERSDIARAAVHQFIEAGGTLEVVRRDLR